MRINNFDENLKFESKFCGADGFLKPNLNLLKFDKATSKFNQSANANSGARVKTVLIPTQLNHANGK